MPRSRMTKIRLIMLNFYPQALVVNQLKLASSRGLSAGPLLKSRYFAKHSDILTLMKNLLKIISIVFFLYTANAFAIRVNAIYKADLPVASQSANERDQMLPDALAQVLTKVSGTTQVLDNPAIKTQLKDASSLMQEYSYQKNTGNTAKPYRLIVQFDSEAINKILTDANIPIWGANRPLITVWIDDELANHSPELIDNSSQNAILNLLKTEADNRGLPIIFPMMDVTDMNIVSSNDFVTQNVPNLQKASERYGSDAILLARIMHSDTGITVQAKLILGKDVWGWNLSDKTMAPIMTTLVDTVTHALAERYATAVKPTIQENMTLKVINVAEEDDFSHMMNYIEHLTPVSDVQIVRVEGNEVILSISLRATRDSFLQALMIGKKLSPVADQQNQNLMVYQWNR